MIELDLAWLQGHPLPEVGGDTDKNARGRVLAAGGSELVPGGLLLTAEAALRSGAGKVQLATVERAALLLGMAMPEAASFPLPANRDGELAAGAGKALADRLEQCDALVLGPGMGPDADTHAILETLVGRPPGDGALLLDAAMIPAAHALEGTDAWGGRRMMTPHFGEMAALMRCSEEEVVPDLAAEAATRFDATIVLKASETWIASPRGEMLHYYGGGAGRATAGSGDVLAGIIGGLLARGAAPAIAASWGVWMHGEAGRRLASRNGRLGFLARELLPLLPGLMEEPAAA